MTITVTHKSTDQCPVDQCELDTFDYSQVTDDGARYVVPERTHKPLVLPDHWLRCPGCTYSWPEWGGERATFGCEECRSTGRARFWSAHAALEGGHYKVTIRCGRPRARAVLGQITMDEDDWADFAAEHASHPHWDISVEAT